MSEDLEKAVLAAEQQRCAAMHANDSEALDELLDPKLYFAHANGAVDGKQAYLDKMAGGRIAYVGIAWSEDVVTKLADDVAMLTGRMATDVTVDGVDKALKNRVTSIWKRTADKWRLLAFQSTPLAG